MKTSLNNSKSTFEKSEKETSIENLDNFDKNNLGKKTQNPSQELTKKLTNQSSNIQTEKIKDQKSKNNSPEWFHALWKFVLIGIAAAGLTYTYPTMKLFVPLFSGLIFLIYFKNFWRQFLVCGGVFGTLIFPIYYLTLKFPEVYNARYESQSLTQSGETMLGGFLARFWEYWTPYFLTGEGDPNKMQQVNGFGSIPESLLILIYLGMGVLLWRFWYDFVIFCKDKFKFKKEKLEKLEKLEIESQSFGQNLENKKQESSLELSPKIDVESDLESGELEKQIQLQKAQKQFSFVDSVQILTTQKSLVLLSALLLSPVAASLTKDHFMSTRAVQMLVMAVIMSGIGFWFVRINLVIWALKLGNLASIFENCENQLKYYFNKNHESMERNKKETENIYNSWKSEIKNQNNNFFEPDFELNKINQNTEIGKTESQNYFKPSSALNSIPIPISSQFPNQFLRVLVNQIETFGQFLSLILLLVLSFQTIHFSSFYFGKFRVEQRASFQFGLLEMYDFLYQNEANFDTVEIDGVNQPYIYHLFWAKPTKYDTKIMTSLIGKYRFGSVERFDLEGYPLMYFLKDVDDSDKTWVKIYAKTPRNWVAVR